MSYNRTPNIFKLFSWPTVELVVEVLLSILLLDRILQFRLSLSAIQDGGVIIMAEKNNDRGINKIELLLEYVR